MLGKRFGTIWKTKTLSRRKQNEMCSLTSSDIQSCSVIDGVLSRSEKTPSGGGIRLLPSAIPAEAYRIAVIGNDGIPPAHACRLSAHRVFMFSRVRGREPSRLKHRGGPARGGTPARTLGTGSYAHTHATDALVTNARGFALWIGRFQSIEASSSLNWARGKNCPGEDVPARSLCRWTASDEIPSSP